MAGYRIGPLEIENVLLTHPSVRECAVVTHPDQIKGEVLIAAIVLKPGFSASAELTLQLQQWVKHRFAAHAYSRQIHYLESLPKTPSGKVQRVVLRQMLRNSDYHCTGV
jgi:acetyl-CoA synthetase